MTGVILCGGNSSRMGSDKGLLLQGDKHWVQHAGTLLAGCGLNYVLSVAPHNLDAYKQFFPDQHLISDADAVPAGGPLKGILSVHLILPSEDLLLLAVDMPAMKPFFLQRLLAEAMAKDVDCVLFRNGEQLEPLCAWYAAKGLSRIWQLLEQGIIHRYSMHHVLDHLKTKIIPIADDPAFRNYNYPEDLSRL